MSPGCCLSNLFWINAAVGTAIDLIKCLRLAGAFVVLAAPISADESSVAAGAPALPATVQIYFSPNGGCTAAITAALDGAQRTILVQAYSFTSVPIAKALKAAKERGVDVRVILDKSQRSERYTTADYLANAGIPVWIDEKPAIAHSKVMVIDGKVVITGSFNFTRAAEGSNVENVVILRSEQVAGVYAGNWNDRQVVSVPYVSRAAREESKEDDR